MAANFARRTSPSASSSGMSLLSETQQKKESSNHFIQLSKSSSEDLRDWQRVSPVPLFSANKELLSQPSSRPPSPDAGTRNDTSILPSNLFSISKTSCEVERLKLEDSADAGNLQETTALSHIPLYGIPEWKKQLTVPELRSHPYLEREEIVIKNPSFLGRLFGGDHISEITLLGCHHGSKYSAESVKQLLESIDPDIVFVELCDERAHYMELSADIANKSFDLVGNIKRAREELGNSTEALYERVKMTYLQHLFARHGSGFAGEMRAATEFVKSKPKETQPLLVLGDLPWSFLNERLNHLTTSGEVLRLEDLYGCKAPRGLSINDEFEDRGYELMEKAWQEEETWAGFYVRAFLDNQDLAALGINRREIHYPEGNTDRATVQERDVYMVSKLHQFCQIMKPKRVVAIIGAAHLPGMRHLLNAGVIGSTHKPEDVIEQLLSSTKSLAESENPLVRDWPSALTFYSTELKVPVLYCPRKGVYYTPATNDDTNELEE